MDNPGVGLIADGRMKERVIPLLTQDIFVDQSA